MSQPLLQVRDLKVHFPIFAGIIRRPVGMVKALDGVDLDLQKGHILGVVGETGSGKTTLGRAILHLIRPTSGQILFKGNDLRTFDSAQLQAFRKHAQIVFQDPFASLNPRKNIRDAIGEGLLFHKIVNTPQAQAEKVAEILSLVGLSPDVMPRYPHEFSGGQQQRICIARAIALEPQLVICDEASSALDVSIQAQILNLLLDLKQKLHLSYIFISHDLSLVRYLCDNVVVLYLGKIMESASVNALFNSPHHPYTQALLSAIPKSHPNESKTRIPLSGEIPSPSHPPSGCPFRTRCPYAQAICAQPPPRQYIYDPATGKNTHFYDCILPPSWTSNGRVANGHGQ